MQFAEIRHWHAHRHTFTLSTAHRIHLSVQFLQCLWKLIRWRTNTRPLDWHYHRMPEGFVSNIGLLSSDSHFDSEDTSIVGTMLSLISYQHWPPAHTNVCVWVPAMIQDAKLAEPKINGKAFSLAPKHTHTYCSASNRVRDYDTHTHTKHRATVVSRLISHAIWPMTMLLQQQSITRKHGKIKSTQCVRSSNELWSPSPNIRWTI